MKSKLAQRLAITYYRTKIRTIGLVSPKLAAEKAYDLFCTPRKSNKKPKVPPIFHKASALNLVSRGQNLRGYHWLPAHPNGKKILIIHGFSSYSYKFEKYVGLFKKEGFEVVAFDAPAHGQSGGKHINALIYKEALLDIEQAYGPFYGWMGHSLGGLAASLAFQTLANQENRKLVLIAPATETKRAIEHYFSIIQVDDKIRQAFNELIASLTHHKIEEIAVSHALTKIKAPVFWVHDKQDTICVFEAVIPIMEAKPANVRFHITDGLGHSRVYKEAEVSGAIVHFLLEA